MKLCLVGCGRWGRVYLNTIQKISRIKVDWIIINKTIPKIEGKYNFSNDLDELLKKEKIDGVVIVSPPHTHFKLAKICIKHHIPVLVEKPFTNSYQESSFLKKEFYKNKLLCMVGYQHLFSSKYRLLKNPKSKIGNVKNVYSISISDGPFRKNINVIRDWGSHEVAIAIDIFDDLPQSLNITKDKKSFTNYHKGLYTLEMNFSKGRKFFSFFGNQSKIKKNQVIVEYESGYTFQDNLCHYGNITICNDKLINIDDINKIHPLPLESSIKEFQKKIKNNSYISNLDLSINVNKILDKLENKNLD